MEKKPCENCPFHTLQLDGTMAGEKKFKIRARLSNRSEIVACLCRLSYAFADFCAYTRNENGCINGAVISCDRGHGYGFDDGEETVALHPYETHSFIHSYTDTSDGTWEDDSFSVTLTLIPFDDEKCSWSPI